MKIIKNNKIKTGEYLEKAGEKFYNIFNNISDGVIFLSEFGNVIDVNKSVVEMFGGLKEELVGKNFTKLDLFSVKDIPVFMRNFKNILNGKKSYLNISVKNKKGQLMDLECSSSIVKIRGRIEVMVIVRDVTARKNAEDKKNLFKIAIESSSDAIGISTPKGKHYYQNKAFDKMFGDIGNSPQKSIYVDKKVGKEVFRTIMAGNKWNGEVKMYGKNKKVMDVLLSAYPVMDNKGKVMSLVGIHSDVTDYNRVEEALRKSEDRFRVMVENSFEGTAIINKEGVTIYESAAIESITGAKADEFVGKKFFNNIHPNDVDLVMKNMAHLTDNPGSRIASSYRIKFPDGLYHYVESTGTNLINNPSIGGIVVNFRDITERKKAEEFLLAEKQKYHEIFENVKDEIVYVDKFGKVIDVNSKIEGIFGWKPEEVIGKNFVSLNMFDLRDLPQIIKLFKKVVKSGKSIDFIELKVRHKDGHRFFIEVSSNAVKKNGKLVGLMMVIRDITERKKAEEKLIHFQMALENATDAIAMSTPEGRHYYQNKAFTKLFGFSVNEINDALISMESIYVDDRVGRNIFNTVKKGDAWIGEVGMFTKDKRKVDISLRAYSIKDSQGKIIGLVGVHTDITEHKKMEIIMRNEKNKLEQYFNTIGAIIIFFNRDGRIILINKKGCEILGYEMKEIMEKNLFDDFVSDEDKIRTRAFVEKLIKNNPSNSQYFENYIFGRNRKKIFISWGNTLVKDESGEASIILGTGIDTTELVESRVAINDLNKINRLKDDFLNIATHELKTPLTSIIGFSEIMKEQKIFCSPEQKKYIEIIHEESSRLAGIVRRILTITRFESGREVIKFEPINLSNFISSFLIKLNVIANKEKSKVIADIEEKNIIIKSDQEKISEVIYNFIDNALKYGSDNQTIVISVTKPNKKLVKIAVKNQGKGIPPEKLDQLFNKFSQLEPSLTRSQEGVGLGLYICKIIIDSLGGKIGVENEPNKGSTFYFTLPI